MYSCVCGAMEEETPSSAVAATSRPVLSFIDRLRVDINSPTTLPCVRTSPRAYSTPTYCLHKGRSVDRATDHRCCHRTIVRIDLIQINHRRARSDGTNARLRSAVLSSFARLTRFRRKSWVWSFLRASAIRFGALYL